MGDELDVELLAGARGACLFCGEATEGFHFLLIHALAAHPVEYVLLRNLAAQGARYAPEQLRLPAAPVPGEHEGMEAVEGAGPHPDSVMPRLRSWPVHHSRPIQLPGPRWAQ